MLKLLREVHVVSEKANMLRSTLKKLTLIIRGYQYTENRQETNSSNFTRKRSTNTTL